MRRTLLAACLAAFVAGAALAEEQKVWRSGWAGMKDAEKVIACAQEIQFNALIFGGTVENMRKWSAMTKAAGIESYYWLSPIARKDNKEMEPFVQVMSPEDDAALVRIQGDKDPKKSGFQWGGEPLSHRAGPRPEPYDILNCAGLLCFHRPETMDWCKKTITEMLAACPDLTGIGLDYFGYQNYRCCLCPHSRKLFEEYQKAHPGVARDQAQQDFSRDTLVAAINELARHARSVRPGVKVTIHVYPTFQPEPDYGWRLDVDTCCETVAWFFEPYWSRERVAEKTRFVARTEGRAFAGSRGVPFFGLYVGRPIADKPAERLAEELKVIRENAGLSALSVCSFNEFLIHDEMRKVMKEALAADK